MNKIKELEQKITQARNDYYNKQSKVSDKVFDAWVDELKTLDPNNKAVTTIGAPVVASEWKKAKHQIPMGSLDKVNLPEELSKWVNEVVDGEKLCIVEKLDGISIEVIYENGKVIQGVTRGNGENGEDITVNVIRMQGVPNKLKDNFTGSLRGEIIMKKSVHKAHFSDKANPRNAASGVAKRLDGVDVDKLNILFYQALGNIEFETEQLQFVWLSNQGLTTPNWWVVKNADAVNKFWRDYQDTKRDKLDYDIDGLVIRIDDLDKQSALGSNNLRPKGARAFKFDNLFKEGYIERIENQLGNSGRITPVAIFNPKINLMGADIEKASLHNFSNIKDLGIDIGCTVLVCRANDVIPFVEEVVKSTGTIFKTPTNCPECLTKLISVGEYIQCPNTESCQGQIVGKIENWISELNVLEWGRGLIEKLVESGKAKTIADLYNLTVDDLANLDRMGDKSAQKCHDILWADVSIPLDVFLGALSMTMIGSSTIKTIMNSGCDTLDKFWQYKASDFEKIAGVGPTKAKFLADGLVSNKKLIQDILKAGVMIKDKINGVLTNKSVCFTGSMENKRAVLEKMVQDAGGEVKGSVGKNLNYLVIADPENSTSSKAVAARKHGTKLISEDEFLDLVK
jgi:DNA ligase (NAD+)